MLWEEDSPAGISATPRSRLSTDPLATRRSLRLKQVGEMRQCMRTHSGDLPKPTKDKRRLCTLRGLNHHVVAATGVGPKEWPRYRHIAGRMGRKGWVECKQVMYRVVEMSHVAEGDGYPAILSNRGKDSTQA